MLKYHKMTLRSSFFTTFAPSLEGICNSLTLALIVKWI